MRCAALAVSRWRPRRRVSRLSSAKRTIIAKMAPYNQRAPKACYIPTRCRAGHHKKGCVDERPQHGDYRAMQAEQPEISEVPAPLSSPRGLKARFDHWRHHNPKTEAVTFFFGGFCFDLLMLHRIDSAPMLIHQGTYLSLLAVRLVVDHRLTYAEERGVQIAKWRGCVPKRVEIRD